MSKNRHVALLLLVLLLATSILAVPLLPAEVEAQEPEPVVYRGESYVDTDLGGGTHSWQSAPQWVFNGSHYVPYIYLETEDYYQVQSGLIGARIFKSGYAEFWNPEMTEVRLYEEAWELQYWSGNKWSVCDTYSPDFSVSSDDSMVNITASFITDWPNAGERAFHVTYIFREGRPLKNVIDFTSHATEQYEFRVAQKWAGIAAAKVKHEKGEEVITSAKTVNGSKFRFLKENGDLSIFQNQWDMYYGYNETDGFYYVLENENLKPVEIDVHAQGLKADFIFSNWTLSHGESLKIDPEARTADLNNPAEDGYIELYSGDYTRYDEHVKIWVSDGSYFSFYANGYVEWDTSSIWDNATILDTDFKYHCTVADYEAHIHEMLGARPTTSTDSEVFAEAKEGTTYVAPVGWPEVGTNQVVDLGTTADAHLESLLASDWFAIGIHPEGGGSLSDFIIVTEEGSSPTPVPTLYVSYTIPNEVPTVTSASIPDRDDGDNLYSMKKYYTWVAVVNDADGATDITEVRLRGMDGTTTLFEVMASNLAGTPVFSIVSGANVIDLDTGGCSWQENVNVGTVTFKIRTEWDHAQKDDGEIQVYVKDKAAGEHGWHEKATNYFDIINRLVTESFAAPDSRINKGASTTLSGTGYYATTTSGNTASSSYPPDAQFTSVRIHDSGHVERGIDTTIVNGAFSDSFNIPDAVQNNIYHIYLDMVADYTDADAPDGDSVSVIGDRMEVVSVGFSDSRVNLDDPAEVRYQLRYTYDQVVFDSGKGSVTGFVWDAVNSWWDKEITGSSSPESVNYDETDIEFTDSTYGITAVEDDPGSNIVYDRWKLLSFWASDDNPKTGETVYLYATAELEFDGHDPDGDDELVIEGVEFTWDWENERFYAEVNKSTAGAITYDTLTSITEYSYNIILGTMNGLSVTVTWGDWEFHFYGLFNENGTFVDAVDVSAHMPTETDIFEVDGYFYKAFTEEPLMFSWPLSGGGNRYIYKFQDNETIHFFTPDETYSVYSFTIRDFSGQIGMSSAYLEALRVVNGTEHMVERLIIWDTANTIPLTLVQSQIYALQVRFADGSVYRFGYFIPGAEGTPTLNIYDIEWGDQLRYVGENITLEFVRPSPEHIRISYKDDNEGTSSIFVEVCLTNSTQVWNDTSTQNLVQFNWYGAVNTTDYMVNLIAQHDDFGEISATGWLTGMKPDFDEPPDFDSVIGAGANNLFAIFLIIGAFMLFSRGTALLGLFVSTMMAYITVYLGILDMPYLPIHVTMALTILWGLSGGDKG